MRAAVAGDFELVRRGDDDDAVDAATPVGQNGLAFAASAGVALDFKDQRRFDNGNGGRIAGEDRLHPDTLGCNDGG